MNVKRSIVFGLAAQGLLLLLSFMATRSIFRELGPEILGVISFSVTLTFLFIAVSDMGMSVFITREVAAHRYSDWQYVQELVGSAITLSWMGFLVSSVVAVALAPVLIDRWLQIEVVDRPSTQLALQMISVAQLFAIFRAVYGSVLAGYDRMDLWNVANLLAVVVQQAGLILVLSAGGRLWDVAAWFCVSAVLGLLPFLYLVYRLSGRSLLLPRWRGHELLRNLRFASHLFVNSLSGFLATQAERWVISRFLSVSMLGYYSFAQGLVSKGNIVPSTIASAVFPSLASSVVTLTDSALNAHYRKLQDFTCYVCFPVSAAVAMLGIVVLGQVFNGEVAELVWRPLLLLSIGQCLMGLLSIPYWLAIALKRPDISTQTNLWAFALVIPVTVVLIYQYGLIGAAASSLVYAGWQLLYFVPRFCAQCLRLPASLWYQQAGVFFVIGLAAYGLPWLLLWAMGRGLDSYGLVTAYLLGTVMFILSGWSVIGGELKHLIRTQVRSLIAGLPA
ncbi:MAG: hypothetical protein JW384_00640 [Nitrosomonadaceae bacterium]|nr:hypothetical protein [Nitrosomonadaceae bacterium]